MEVSQIKTILLAAKPVGRRTAGWKAGSSWVLIARMSDEPSLPPSPLLMPSPFLGPTQRRIAAFALTLLAILGSAVLLVNLIVQSVESRVLTPNIMGAQTGLHPAVVIIAIFLWGTAFSDILGMLLAIPLTAFFVTAWRLARIKYLSSATVP